MWGSLRGCPTNAILDRMRNPVLLLALGALPLAAQVTFTRAADRVDVSIDGKPATTLWFGPGKPYLHPLRAPSGRVVTRLYPMETVAGEPHDHPHHRGLWFSHGDVNGYDFWGNDPSQQGPKTGRIAVAEIVALKDGAKSGTLEARFDWLDPAGKRLLREQRTMTFRVEPQARVIDVEIELEPEGEVVFGDTTEGTFAIRLAPWLEAPGEGGTATMLDSEGRTGEAQIWGHRANWVDYSGEKDGEKLGVAILDHPSNPRHPTWWHARGYGLFAANIFGWRDFEHDKTKDGSLALEPGQSLRFRYRVIIHSGDARAANIAARYAEFR